MASTGQTSSQALHPTPLSVMKKATARSPYWQWGEHLRVYQDARGKDCQEISLSPSPTNGQQVLQDDGRRVARSERVRRGIEHLNADRFTVWRVVDHHILGDAPRC